MSTLMGNVLNGVPSIQTLEEVVKLALELEEERREKELEVGRFRFLKNSDSDSLAIFRNYGGIGT